MDNKMLMEGLLVSTKAAADLYLHGTIEASNQNIKNAFEQALTQTLQMQTQIHQKMSEKGWYPMTTVEQQKIQQVAQKFQAKA